VIKILLLNELVVVNCNVRYQDLLDYVAQPANGVPLEPIPPLQIGVPKRVKSVVQGKMDAAGITGEFVVFHGIESDSAASMTSRGDTDSLLPLQFWGQLREKLQLPNGCVLCPRFEYHMTVVSILNPFKF
jgi:hypothetical protein